MKTIRIGNAAGFWGDNLDAPRRLAEQAGVGGLNYLTLEYLAELTMSILAHLRSRDPSAGYVTDFPVVVESLIPQLKSDPGLKIVTNGGGMNPAACAAKVSQILSGHGLADTIVAAVSGDDLLPDLDAHRAAGQSFANMETGASLESLKNKVVCANAYLGAAGIVDALDQGARIVITGRVADASLVVGPAVHEFGWPWDDWNALGAATVAGHLIECGAQMTGGMYSDWTDAIDLADVGYPIVELAEDGSSVVTKPEGSGGLVSVGTVSEQLVYEIGDPEHYLTPDVDADFSQVALEEIGENRVRVTGGAGRSRPGEYKVSLAFADGYRSAGTLVIAGRDAEQKAQRAAETILARLRAAESEPQQNFPKRTAALVQKIIIDADAGIGDALAIALALFDPDVDVVALTATAGCVSGSNATRNIQAIVENLDPPKWPRLGEATSTVVPPAAADDEMLPGSVDMNGPTGLGDYDFQVAGLHNLHDAAKIMIDVVRDQPNEITLLTLGPLTNVERARERWPDFLGQLKGLCFAGGAMECGGDATATAEFNMYADPEAARSLLLAKATKTLIPLDVSLQPTLTFEMFDRMCTRLTTPLARFLSNLLPFAFRANHEHCGKEGVCLQELTALCYIASPELFKTRRMSIDVETAGELTRGMTVFDRRQIPRRQDNIDVAWDLSVQGVLDYFERIIQQDYAAKLEKLAQAREANQQQKEAIAIRKMAADALKPQRSIEPLPTRVQPGIPRTLPAEERAWRIELRKANLDYANGLYGCAQAAIRNGFASFSYQLIRDVIRSNPDHVAARRLLGYVRDGDEWLTPFAKKKKRLGEVWDEKFGWIKKEHVARYHDGQRFSRRPGSTRGVWIPAARDAAEHARFSNPWVIRTEHYLVKTNYSLERGVEVASLLENYYQYFFQTFAGFFNSREQMKKLFGGANRSRFRTARPYIVHYYKDKEEYVAALQRKIPQIAITNGLYLTDTRTAYFFHTPNVNNNNTLYHEATHQIFYESLQKHRMIAQKHHFWIIEGIACYMESFSSENGKFSLGDPGYIRFAAAKSRYTQNKYYVPLEKLAQMGMREFQTHRKIRWNYSQASGMSKFFMEYDGGRYRDALIEHLSQLYRAGSSRNARVDGLDVLTGVSYEELDRHPWQEVDRALDAAAEAARAMRGWPGERFAAFMENYADRIDAAADELAELANRETALPVSPRLKDVELPRTSNQLRQAAAAARDGSWAAATIDTNSGIRSMFGPIGPVAVFGPNNFPFAFNGISGGDFAAAVAAGNPVIAKGHSSHPATTRRFAEEALAAAKATEMPPGFVQLIYRTSHADGAKLVSDPRLGATGYTGSRSAGLVLKEAADRVGKPIYLELSSINPVFILPGALKERGDDLAKEFAGSCLMGTGQFCTNPGLVVLLAGSETDAFIETTTELFRHAPVGTLLGKGVQSGFAAGIETLKKAGAELLVGGEPGGGQGFSHANSLLRVDGKSFVANPEALQTEAFGNGSLIVVAENDDEMRQIAESLEGNLTGCFYSDTKGSDDALYDRIEPAVRVRVGRLMNDKMPTGVAVSPAMNHGGPFPATGHPGFTAVGIPASIVRFSMLCSYDAVRPHRLPPLLQDANPNGSAWRSIDGQWTQGNVG
eukprot:g21980.t1